MERCTRCGFPDTRPGIIFKGDVCQACLNYEKRKYVDWNERWNDFRKLSEMYRNGNRYDCIIPVSGGKDSYFLVHTATEMGLKPLCVTVTDPFTHTKAGIHNLSNLLNTFGINHWQYRINEDLFRRATRAAFEDKGEPLKFIEYAIYTIPVMLARALNIGLVIFGENSGYEYGSREEDTFDADPDIVSIIEKCRSEKSWWATRGVTGEEIESILPPGEWDKEVQAVYMSYFRPWSSVTHLEIARKYGFKDLDDTGEWFRKGTIEQFEQIDSKGYLFHLWMKYPKFGFQRVSDIASRRVREGAMTLRQAQAQIFDKDPVCDPIAKKDFADFCGYDEGEMWEVINKWWSPNVPRD